MELTAAKEKNGIYLDTKKGEIEISENCYWVKNNKKIFKKDAILELQRKLNFRFEEPEIKEDFRDKPFSTVVVGLKTEDGNTIYGVGSGNYMNLYGFSVDIPTDMAYKRAKSNATIDYLSYLCDDVDSILYADEERDNIGHSNMKTATENLVFNIQDKSIVLTPNEYYLIEVFEEYNNRVKQMNVLKKSGIAKIQKTLNLQFGKPIIKETINYGKTITGEIQPKQFITIKTPLITEEGIFGYGLGTASPNNLDKFIGIKYAPEMAYKRSKSNIVIEYLKYVSGEELPLYSEHDYFNDNNSTPNRNTNNFNNNFNSNNNFNNNIVPSNNEVKTVSEVKEVVQNVSSKATNNIIKEETKTISNNIETKEKNVSENEFSEQSMLDVFTSFKDVLNKESKKETNALKVETKPKTKTKEKVEEVKTINAPDLFGNNNDGITATYFFDEENPKSKNISSPIIEDSNLGDKELRGIAKYSEGITIKELVNKDKKIIENMYKRFGNLEEKDIVDESSRKWFNILNDIKEYFKSINMTIEEYLK